MFSDYKKILIQQKNAVVEIILNRPEIHNAFDDQMILELQDSFMKIQDDPQIRVAVITGQGKSFCAGADMTWMRRMKNYTLEENLRDSSALSCMFETLYRLPIPTIAKVNGSAFGGGVGLVAACDIAIASDSALFSLSEVRIGLVPACISPYLLKKMPLGTLRPYFLTGMRFHALQAQDMGLLFKVVPHEQLNSEVSLIIENILSSGPQAIKMAKKLMENVPSMSAQEYMPYTAEMIAKLRTSEEGQEGLSAFLEKRNPKWKVTI